MTTFVGPRIRNKALRRFLRNPGAVVGSIVLFLVLVTAVFAPQIAPYDPYKQTLPDRRAPPSDTHLMGADEFGRYVFSRVLYGSRVALRTGIISTAVGLVLGILFGTIAGLFGGVLDEIIMRIMDVL